LLTASNGLSSQEPDQSNSFEQIIKTGSLFYTKVSFVDINVLTNMN